MGAHIIPKRDSNGNTITDVSPFGNKYGYVFDGNGFSGNALKNVETEISFTCTKTYDLSGVEVLNGVVGDQVQMQVRDTAAGTYSGTPNAVLNQFGTNWNIRPNFVKNLPYTARLYPGMQVVFIYKNNDAVNDRSVYFNLDLHEVVA